MWCVEADNNIFIYNYRFKKIKNRRALKARRKKDITFGHILIWVPLCSLPYQISPALESQRSFQPTPNNNVWILYLIELKVHTKHMLGLDLGLVIWCCPTPNSKLLIIFYDIIHRNLTSTAASIENISQDIRNWRY